MPRAIRHRLGRPGVDPGKLIHPDANAVPARRAKRIAATASPLSLARPSRRGLRDQPEALALAERCHAIGVAADGAAGPGKRGASGLGSTTCSNARRLPGRAGVACWGGARRSRARGRDDEEVLVAQESASSEIREIVARELARRPGGAASAPGLEQDLVVAVRSLLAQGDEGDATAAQIAELLRQDKTDEAIDIQVAAAEARERRMASEAKRAAKDYREAAALAATDQAGPGAGFVRAGRAS